ncbi:MAG: hypothetical protein ABI193_27070 [Minicystis sp.]
MRQVGYVMITTGLLSAAAWVSGCGTTYDDCLSGKIGACKGIYTDTTGSGGSTTSTTGSGGQGGTGGSPPIVCQGDPTTDPTVVDPSCGVFVRADAASEGNGDPETPYKTLQAAIDKATATGRWVFACTAGEFKESVVLDKAVEVYGGFDCTNPKQWAWKKDTKTKLTGAPNAVTLRVSTAATKVLLDDLAIKASSSAPGVPGGSSIALILDSVTANLNRCELTAGDATAGPNGEDAEVTAPPKPPKTAANDGKPACAVAGGGQSTGGDEIVNDCGGGMSSTGGLGGSSTSASGKVGAAGVSTPPTADMGGVAGLADILCGGGGNGGLGADGGLGAPGAPGTGLGTLDSMMGWAGTAAKAGDPGTPGQGGGGGGGKRGGAMVCSGAAGSGATGGSGGAGGCGGHPGGGGRFGGSSIALVSVNSKSAVVTLNDCKLQAGKAGDGGRGGNAQLGGEGGDAGKGGSGVPANLPSACDGGPGGHGGDGGPGGGASGGHSLAIAYNGLKPTAMKSTLKSGTAGGPGMGGALGGVMAPSGDAGMAPADGTLMFP